VLLTRSHVRILNGRSDEPAVTAQLQLPDATHTIAAIVRMLTQHTRTLEQDEKDGWSRAIGYGPLQGVSEKTTCEGRGLPSMGSTQVNGGAWFSSQEHVPASLKEGNLGKSTTL
jgi:hypothetical protein